MFNLEAAWGGSCSYIFPHTSIDFSHVFNLVEVVCFKWKLCFLSSCSCRNRENYSFILLSLALSVFSVHITFFYFPCPFLNNSCCSSCWCKQLLDRHRVQDRAWSRAKTSFQVQVSTQVSLKRFEKWELCTTVLYYLVVLVMLEVAEHRIYFP